MAEKVTVGLASHWPCVTDFSGLYLYGLDGLRKEDEYGALYLFLGLHVNHRCNFCSRSLYADPRPSVCPSVCL